MKWFDRYLQSRRFRMAAKILAPNQTILDIGCHKGEFFVYLSSKNICGIGLDVGVDETINNLPPGVSLIDAKFPEGVPDGFWFDHITALAVFEHIPENEQEQFAKKCHALLKSEGYLIITVPSPRVDQILKILKSVQLLDGMKDEEHTGFKPSRLLSIMENAGFCLVSHQHFEFRLNNLFVFRKMGY